MGGEDDSKLQTTQCLNCALCIDQLSLHSVHGKEPNNLCHSPRYLNTYLNNDSILLFYHENTEIVSLQDSHIFSMVMNYSKLHFSVRLVFFFSTESREAKMHMINDTSIKMSRHIGLYFIPLTFTIKFCVNSLILCE